MEINIMFGVGEIEWEGVDWIDLARDRDEWCNVLNAVIKNSDTRTVGK